MKKLVFTSTLALSLTSCAELTAFANILQPSSTMPSYEFYEKFSETNNTSIVLPILEKNLTTGSDEYENTRVFKFSPSLVNESTFNWFDPNYDEGINNYITYSPETKNNKIEYISLGFSHVLTLNKSNFYKIFNLDPKDISITQLKQHCEAYNRFIALHKLSLKNGKSLYLAHDMGSGGRGASSDLIIFRYKPICKSFGNYKTVKKYLIEDFEK